MAIDDHYPMAFSGLLADQRAESAVSFLKTVVARYGVVGVTIRRVLTDNGSCYPSRKFRKACRLLGIKHVFTRPYTPKTNGKAERFMQMALREWALPWSIKPQHTCRLPTSLALPLQLASPAQ